MAQSNCRRAFCFPRSTSRDSKVIISNLCRAMSCDYSDQFSARKRLSIFEQLLRPIGQNQITMNTPKLFTIAAVSAGLALGVVTQAKEKEEEQSISSSDVPAAVQQAADAQAKGGKIDANGKVVSKHDESKEHKEKGEKY